MNECHELKSIKYKSMLLNGNNDKKETVENVSNLDFFLEDEKKNTINEPWTKLDKTTKLLKFNDFVNEYIKQNEDYDNINNNLFNFLSGNLARKRLLKAKEVLYDKDNGKIISIPSLLYNNNTKKFTLKRCEKRQSTTKSLAPKKCKKSDKNKN